MEKGYKALLVFPWTVRSERNVAFGKLGTKAVEPSTFPSRAPLITWPRECANPTPPPADAQPAAGSRASPVPSMASPPFCPRPLSRLVGGPPRWGGDWLTEDHSG